MNIFKHIKTAFDDDPFANTFVYCPGCESWSDASVGNSCCPYCGRDFDGDEDTQCGRYPPGWGEDES